MNPRLVAAVVLVATSCASMVSLSSPADAHNSSAHYVTTFTGITPHVAGLTVNVASNGDYLEVTNTGATPVVIEGYQHEPYLRIGPGGTYQNSKSTATYLNKEATIDAIPDAADPKAVPVWERIGNSPVARWHDHRIHWMGNGIPPAVAKDPSRAQLIKTWSVPARVGSTTITLAGELRWLPEKPADTAWILVFVATLVVILSLVLLGVRRQVAHRGPTRPQ